MRDLLNLLKISEIEKIEINMLSEYLDTQDEFLLSHLFNLLEQSPDVKAFFEKMHDIPNLQEFINEFRSPAKAISDTDEFCIGIEFFFELDMFKGIEAYWDVHARGFVNEDARKAGKTDRFAMDMCPLNKFYDLPVKFMQKTSYIPPKDDISREKYTEEDLELFGTPTLNEIPPVRLFDILDAFIRTVFESKTIARRDAFTDQMKGMLDDRLSGVNLDALSWEGAKGKIEEIISRKAKT